MSEKESQELGRNMLKATDTSEVFKAKVDSLNRLTDLQKHLDLRNLHKSKRDVSGFSGEMSAYANANPEDPRFKAYRTASSSQQQGPVEQTRRQADGSYKVYRQVPGGWVPK